MYLFLGLLEQANDAKHSYLHGELAHEKRATRYEKETA